MNTLRLVAQVFSVFIGSTSLLLIVLLSLGHREPYLYEYEDEEDDWEEDGQEPAELPVARVRRYKP